MKDLKEILNEMYERNISLLNYTEAKNAGLLTINLAVLIFFNEISSKKVECLIKISVIFFVSSIIVNIISFIPKGKVKLRNKKELPIWKNNLLFYMNYTEGSINLKKIYKALIKRYGITGSNYDNYTKDLIEQIVTYSRIIKRKNGYFFLGSSLTIFGLITFLLFYLI